MPTPLPYERQDDFVQRCIPELIDEGKSREEAVAICYTYWNKK
jgi:hypothetical protein